MSIQPQHLQIFKKNALPSKEQLVANAMYLVSEGNGLVVYVTNKSGTATLSTISANTVASLIATATAATLLDAKQNTETKFTEANEYTDSKFIEAGDYTDTKFAEANEHTDNQFEDALKKANKYTDEEISHALRKFNPNNILVVDLYSDLIITEESLHNKFILVRDASGDKTVNSGSATYVFDEYKNQFIKIAEHESMDLQIKWSEIQEKPEVLTELSDNKGQLFYKGKPVVSINEGIVLSSVEW